MFIYLDDGIQWTQADLKPGVAEISAQAGFDSGSQGYPAFVMPGSGFPEAIDWDK